MGSVKKQEIYILSLPQVSGTELPKSIEFHLKRALKVFLLWEEPKDRSWLTGEPRKMVETFIPTSLTSG